MLLPHMGERPGSAQVSRNASVSRSAAAVSMLLAQHARRSSPKPPCCLRFQSSMRGKHGLALVHGEHRAFGEHVQVLVGYDRGNFDDEVGVRLAARSFQDRSKRDFRGISCVSLSRKTRNGSRATQLKDTSGSGVVLASYGRGVLVQADAITLHCSSQGTQAAHRLRRSGHVGVRTAAEGPSVESIEPRRNLFERIDARGRAEPVAANIDRLAIVVAPEPAPDWFLVDRYWAGAQLKDIAAVLIVNKSDLGTDRRAVRVGDLPSVGSRLPRSVIAVGHGDRRA